MKIYCLADECRYVWDFWLYEGKESERDHSPTEIVLGFIKEVQKKESIRPHIITVDSYYGSEELVKKVDQMKWGIVASCRSDRPSKLFSDFLHYKLTKGDHSCISNSKFSAITYYDKAKVNILTNMWVGDKVIKDPKTKSTLPIGIFWYRRWLGGLDQFDRYLHLYFSKNKNIKWTTSLLKGLLKMAIVNTFIIRKYFTPDLEIKKVIYELIGHLSGNYSTRSPKSQPILKKNMGDRNHWPKKVKLLKKCIHCQQQGKRSNTSYRCSSCEVSLHPECMKLYHSEQK